MGDRIREGWLAHRGKATAAAAAAAGVAAIALSSFGDIAVDSTSPPPPVTTVVATTTPPCLLYPSDAADDLPCVDLGCRRIIKKKIYTQYVSLIALSATVCCSITLHVAT